MSVSRIFCASSGLSSLRTQTTPTVLVKLEPEGRSMIKAALLMRNQRKSAESTSRTAPCSSWRPQLLALPTAEVQDRVIHLCENSVSEDSAKLLFRERLRYYSLWNGCSNCESCRVCENFATWLNVEKYWSCITALRVGPARAVIGASSMVHTPSVSICLFASVCSAGITQARDVCTSPLDFL